MFRSKWRAAAGSAASSRILLMIVTLYRTLMSKGHSQYTVRTVLYVLILYQYQYSRTVGS